MRLEHTSGCLSNTTVSGGQKREAGRVGCRSLLQWQASTSSALPELPAGGSARRGPGLRLLPGPLLSPDQVVEIRLVGHGWPRQGRRRCCRRGRTGEWMLDDVAPEPKVRPRKVLFRVDIVPVPVCDLPSG